jgi:hypothetical protein
MGIGGWGQGVRGDLRRNKLYKRRQARRVERAPPIRVKERRRSGWCAGGERGRGVGRGRVAAHACGRALLLDRAGWPN